MTLRLTFLGAAGTVTGWKYLLEVGPRRVLIDCGLLLKHEVVDRAMLDALLKDLAPASPAPGSPSVAAGLQSLLPSLLRRP
jgi:hypothetical protein